MPTCKNITYTVTSGNISITFDRQIICEKAKYIDKSDNSSQLALVFDT